ncbi:hypothetical protein [Ruegeria arenilitoris]|uniref:hypothetical protein n=1 Tax=Ruegeria arenilitoris TaxID=1173585 RepID=UPI003C79C601
MNEANADVEQEPMNPETTFVELAKIADNYLRPIGLGQELVETLFEEDWDWAFTVQLDALLETAAREAIRNTLILKLPNGATAKVSELGSLVDRMSYQGAVSLFSLLVDSGLSSDRKKFISSVRQIRNQFAHDIRNRGRTLFEMIEDSNNSDNLLRSLGKIEQGANLVPFKELLKENSDLFRMTMLEQAMSFLYWLHFNYTKE